MKEREDVENSVASHVEDKPEEDFIYDPYELSRRRDESNGCASGQPRQKFNVILFVVISTVVCVLMCRSCNRFMTHPSEFVLGSPPDAFVHDGQLERQDERVTHDVNLFYECLGGIIGLKNPEKQIERFINNKYGVLKKTDRKCVELLKMFVVAGEECRRLFADYAVAWTNSGALAIYCDNWNSEHDKREWADLVKDAETTQNLLATGIHAFEKKNLEKIEKIIGTHKGDKAWVERMKNIFMNEMSSEAFPVKQFLIMRSNQVDVLVSLVELYRVNRDKIKEVEGQMIFTDEALSKEEKDAWNMLDKGEKDIANLLASPVERQNL